MSLRRRWILALAGLVLAGIAPLALAQDATPSGPASGPASGPTAAAVPVRVADVITTTMVEQESYAGSLSPWNKVKISPGTAGNVLRIMVEQGQKVVQGAAMFQLDDRIAKAELARTLSLQTTARAALDRAQTLMRSGNTTEMRVESASSDYATAAANATTAQTRLDTLTLKAPFPGVIGLVKVSPGAYVQPGDELTELFDLSKIYVDFNVRQGLLTRVTPGQPFEITSDALGGRSFRGTVTFVAPNVDPANRAVALRGEIDNPDGALVPGVAVRVNLQLARHENTVAVPVDALVPTMLGNDVFRLNGDRVERVAVEVGLMQGGLAQVVSGLKPGDKVVTLGQFRLEDRSLVKVVQGGGA